jgi:hypothetical protein
MFYKRLCDPKSKKLLPNNQNESCKTKTKDHMLLDLKANDEKSPSNNNNGKAAKNKNPYKWIMEEFEDKNLDKVKRTLLVALDDISKGTSN